MYICMVHTCKHFRCVYMKYTQINYLTRLKGVNQQLKTYITTKYTYVYVRMQICKFVNIFANA